MPAICGNTYETTLKYLVIPIVDVKRVKIEEIGKNIGYKCIAVDYIVWVHKIPDLLIAYYMRNNEIKEWISHIILHGISDKSNWKLQARGAYEVEDFTTATLLVDALVYKCGGAWLIFAPGYYKREESIFVWTKGYYRYIGA